ncbi:hypothetical protein PPYR_02494 [Photinus pyralis]|uniref:Uncharacterized protein n=1 Tax=Photinus pyralis TaxID=7054 RepID=A0A5N4B7J1_PHOPY|nr:hypothetical protein PPYR_02494 [Photinus pyralis]
MKPWQWRRYKQCIMRVTTFFAILPLIFAYHFNADDDLVEAWEAMVRPYEEKCVTEVNVKREEVVGTISRKVYPTLKIHQCYAKCLFEGLGFYEPKNGNFRIELILEQIKGMTKEIADDCYTKYLDEKDECRKVFSSIVCATEKISKVVYS